MNEESMVEILINLSSAVGVSGEETAAVETAATLFKKHTDSVTKDRFGNLIALKKGEAPEGKKLTLALVAHIDEIGAMVTTIEPAGFLRFTSVGGIDPRVLPGQAVTVHGSTPHRGVIGATAPHLLTEEERAKSVPIDKLFIDVGLSFEAANSKIKVGDYISFSQDPVKMHAGKTVTGKALDNRAGITALLKCASDLSGLRHQADICFIASLQEEVGLRGAVTAAYGLKPDLAVAVDVTHGDLPGLDDRDTFKIGAGPALAVGPNFHPIFSSTLQQIAKDYNLPFQVEPIPAHSGTDAWAIQVSREGIPTALISIPLRYMHSPVELINTEDLYNTGRLLAYLSAGITNAFLGEMRGC